MLIIGIDPGASGGLAFLTDALHIRVGGITWRPDVARLFKAPDSAAGLYELLDQEYNDHWGIHGGATVAWVEKVHSFPGQGVSSTFSFGKNYGIILGVLAALRIRVEHVSPPVWQRELGCLSRGDKNVTKRRAQELFPRFIGMDSEHPSRIIHATADALLIAEYGRRAATGTLTRSGGKNLEELKA